MQETEPITCEICDQPLEVGEYNNWLHVNEPSIYTPSHRPKPKETYEQAWKRRSEARTEIQRRDREQTP